jgi:hypothetical protein
MREETVLQLEKTNVLAATHAANSQEDDRLILKRRLAQESVKHPSDYKPVGMVTVLLLPRGGIWPS